MKTYHSIISSILLMLAVAHTMSAQNNNDISANVFIAQDTTLLNATTVNEDIEIVEVTPQDSLSLTTSSRKKNFYMDFRTNMLYDVLALPNIGIDFYLGKNFTIGANWLYAWWGNNAHHRYWRAYGGEVNAMVVWQSSPQEAPLRPSYRCLRTSLHLRL